MLKYEEMKNKIFATGTIPDGYAGKIICVGFAHHEGKTIVVAPCGYFTSGLPDSVDAQESLWLLKNHPNSNATKIQAVKQAHKLIKTIDTPTASWLIYKEKNGYSFKEILESGSLWTNPEIYTKNGINSMLIQRHKAFGYECKASNLI